MTEAERNSFMAYSMQRAPGKRQIKPTKTAQEMVVLPADDEEDDEDFKVDLSGSGSEGGESTSESDSSDNDEEGDGEGEADGDEKYLAELKHNQEALDEAPPVCSLCLNLRPATVNDEVIQCDKCGVAVHERCYAPEQQVIDEHSSESSSSMEPWFCEPCIYGEKEPPHCQLCPSRYGAFKRSDIGGQWVHLVCALYTPGITFAILEQLTAVCWQDLDYRRWGRRACNGCSELLESRTGIVVECDAALCRSNYHVTCAQKLGLLEDRTDEMAALPDEERDHEADEKFLHCKRHSSEEAIRKRREAFAIFVRQEERRFATMYRKKRLVPKEEEKRLAAYDKSVALFRSLEKQTIIFPDASYDTEEKKMKQARRLHTSSQFLEAFAEKAETSGVARDQFKRSFVKVDGSTLPFLPPALSEEFCGYFNNREKHVMAAERARLARVKAENERLRLEQKATESRCKDLDASSIEARSMIGELSGKIASLHGALAKIGVRNLPKLADIIKRDVPVTPSFRTRRHSKSTGGPMSPTTPTESGRVRKPSTRVHLLSCDTCKEQSDQHLITQCDACKRHYHLGCLDPPLERMPVRSKWAWHCSECALEEDEREAEEKKGRILPDDEVEEEEADGSDDDRPTRRKLRHRSDSEKQRKENEKKEEMRCYKSAIARGAKRAAAGGPAVVVAASVEKAAAGSSGVVVASVEKAKKEPSMQADAKALQAKEPSMPADTKKATPAKKEPLIPADAMTLPAKKGPWMPADAKALQTKKGPWMPVDVKKATPIAVAAPPAPAIHATRFSKRKSGMGAPDTEPLPSPMPSPAAIAAAVSAPSSPPAKRPSRGASAASPIRAPSAQAAAPLAAATSPVPSPPKKRGRPPSAATLAAKKNGRLGHDENGEEAHA